MNVAVEDCGNGTYELDFKLVAAMDVKLVVAIGKSASAEPSEIAMTLSRVRVSPASPLRLSTWSTSPFSTRYCLPPVSMMA